MFSLRRKLALGFGGLLLLMVILGGSAILLLSRYSRTIERISRENYDSVVFAQEMKESIERLDGLAESVLWREDAASPAPGALSGVEEEAGRAAAEFERNLRLEAENITIPGEMEVVQELNLAWKEYRTEVERLLAGRLPAAEARALYRSALRPLRARVREKAQRVIDLNLQNIVSVDGQVKESARRASRGMVILLAVGGGFAAVFVGLVGRAILVPLRTLTRSARDIERGNLDLVVPVRSRDELGQLAEAFNSMTARLREFRRTDRARLLRTQRTTQLAIDSLPDAVAVVSPEGVVEMANESARRLFQLREGAGIQEARIDGLLEAYRRVVADGRPFRPQGYESAVQVFDQEERFFLPQAVPVLDDDRSLAGVTLVLVDVTHLRRLDEMKSGLLSVVSHELKTPLTSIRMALHLLLEEKVGTLSEKQAELLVAAREESDRLARIIEGLLDIGRIRSGRALLDIRPTAPEALVSAAVDAAEPGYREKGVKLEWEVAPAAPAVLADPVRVGHVISNLLDNALRYTAPGGTVKVGAAIDADGVAFSVEDTGVGIPPESIPFIFERFYRVPGQATGSGVGLGLAIAKEVVEAHGGRIGVESRPACAGKGEGSRFRFTLPAARLP